MKQKTWNHFPISAYYVIGVLWLIIAIGQITADDIWFGIISGMLGCAYLVRAIYETIKNPTDIDKE